MGDFNATLSSEERLNEIRSDRGTTDLNKFLSCSGLIDLKVSESDFLGTEQREKEV